MSKNKEMYTQSMTKNSKENQIKRTNNEVLNTVNKKPKSNAENELVNCTNSKKKENIQTVQVSATVQSQSRDLSNNLIKKRSQSSGHISSKISTDSLKVQPSTSMNIDQQLQVNAPSLPANAFLLPGCSNDTKNIQTGYTSATVASECGDLLNNAIKKQTQSCSIESLRKYNQFFEGKQLISITFDKQSQVNVPLLPDNVLPKFGLSNDSSDMTNVNGQNCIPYQTPFEYFMYTSLKQNIPVMPINIMPDVSSQIMSTILPNNHETHSKIINYSNTIYNEDVVTVEKQIECVICLENMDLGQKIARLQCLCIYHKSCIDLWFNKKVWCPSHPPS